MRKISLQSVFIVTLLLVNIWAIFKISKANTSARELHFLASSRKTELNDLQKNFNTLRENVSMALKMGKNKLHAIPPIDSMIRGKKTWLILRVHQNNCNECVIQSLRIIEKSNLALPVAVVANFPSADGLFTNFGEIKVPVVLASRISLDISGVTNPYFFVMDNKGEVSNIFFPNWKMMDIFEDYIESLK